MNSSASSSLNPVAPKKITGLQGPWRRVLFVGLYELIAIVCASGLFMLIGQQPGESGAMAVAASVIAMAGTKVLVSPVSMLMIHNPMTAAFGNSDEMQKAIEMLSSVKDSIINAYEIKTGLSRAKLSHLMDAETWMDAHTAIDMGFCR